METNMQDEKEKRSLAKNENKKGENVILYLSIVYIYIHFL